ncbi:MAG: DUF4363 family protein [Anaerolineae bacterium]|nr:DUF4363 family protein [Anaerolineae bacterium]
MRKPLQIAALVIGLLFVFSGALAAQDVLSITPAQLTLNGVQGHSLSRSVVVQSAAPLSKLTLIPLELTNAEGHILVPALADSATLPADLENNLPLSVPLRFDLADVAAGVYSGEILITYTGGSRSVPVQVSVKSQPWWPLGALVAGVALGIGVTNYRAKGRPRDKVMVRLGQLRTQMKIDQELHTLGKPFCDRLTAELADVEVALEAQQWEQAQTAAEEAVRVWTLWRRGRPDWLVQLTAHAKFVEWLATADPGARYVAELKQAAEDIRRNTPDLDGPQTLRAQMVPLTHRANAFMELQMRIEKLAGMGAHGTARSTAYQQQLTRQSPLDNTAGQALQALAGSVEATLTKLRKADLTAMLAHFRVLVGDDPAEALVATLATYQTRIDTLPTDADAFYIELRADLNADIRASGLAAADGTIPEGAVGMPFSGSDAVNAGLVVPIRPQLMTELPQVRVHSLEDQAPAARHRLRWFTWVTYGVAVVVLALAGFVELYSIRPDFGARGVSEYFALLVWGFGAEATRSAVADMIQSWGVVRQ